MGDGRGAQPWACIYMALQKNVDANGARLGPCHNLDSSTKKMMEEKKSEKKIDRKRIWGGGVRVKEY